jgi:transcription elongation factor Elf1
MEFECPRCGRTSDVREICDGLPMQEKKPPAPREEFVCRSCGRLSEVRISCCGMMMDKKK